MAGNAIYPKFKELALGLGLGSGTKPTGTLKAVLVDTGTYTYSAAHQFASSLTGQVGTAVAIGTPAFTNGVLTGGNVTETAVTGNSAEAVVLFFDTGTAGTSPLVAYFDTSVTGLPVTPNSGDINIVWNGSGIFAL